MFADKNTLYKTYYGYMDTIVYIII